MIIMAIDLGKARTGIAVSDNTMFLASPLCVIEEWNRGKLAEKIAQLVRQEKAELIVMGLPKWDFLKIWTAQRAKVLLEQESLQTSLHSLRTFRLKCRTNDARL